MFIQIIIFGKTFSTSGQCRTLYIMYVYICVSSTFIWKCYFARWAHKSLFDVNFFVFFQSGDTNKQFAADITWKCIVSYLHVLF